MLKTLTIAAVVLTAVIAATPAHACGGGDYSLLIGCHNGVSLNGINAAAVSPGAAIAGSLQAPAIELPATH